jgi:hypothetical protein
MPILGRLCYYISINIKGQHTVVELISSCGVVSEVVHFQTHHIMIPPEQSRDFKKFQHALLFLDLF